MNLYARRAGSGAPVVLLHGLFGAGNNLGALSRHLQSGHEVISLDLPNHGRSDWLPVPDLAGMAAAVGAWIEGQGLGPAALVGHSLGGKVAMQLALARPAAVAGLVVADIAPVTYEPRHDAVLAALEAVAGGDCQSREEAAGLLRQHLAEEAVVLFLLTALQRTATGRYDWRFDLAGLSDAYAGLRAAPDAAQPYNGPTLFIAGALSDYITPAHHDAIARLFPAARIETIAGAGHWLHAEQPQRFNELVAGFLAEHAL